MPEDEKPQKINIGFLGGQVLSARVPSAELTRLRAALGSPGWHDLTSADGIVALDLNRIVYVLIDTEGNRVGFGT
jgi:hypothetical protein